MPREPTIAGIALRSAGESGLLQNFRRVVVRYERFAENFLGMLCLACCVILLRPSHAFFATMSAAQGKRDEAAIRNILQEEAAAWNKGDAQAYSQHFAADGTFTVFWGCSSPGHQAFLDRHEEIFKGRFRGTALGQDVVSLRFVAPGPPVVETLTWVSGLSASGPPPGVFWHAKGSLRARLL